jgi:hypothetical protein
MDSLTQAILGVHPEPNPPRAQGVVEGKVKNVDAKGLYFTVPDWDGGKFTFGPAPWPVSRVEPAVSGADAPHDHAETKPSAGDRCLVVFEGEGVSNPWCVGWWPA